MSNKLDQNDRRAIAGSTTGTTYHKLAQIDQELELGGRYREKETITGSERTTDYRRLPEGSFWAGDPVGLEPSLGYSVDDLEPVGTYAEVQASLELGGLSAPVDMIPGSETAASSPVVETSPPIPSADARLAGTLPRIAVKRRRI